MLLQKRKTDLYPFLTFHHDDLESVRKALRHGLTYSPLKLNIGIRDFWDNEGSDVSLAKAALKAAVGLDAIVNVNWGIIFDELGDVYEDHKMLASTMAGFVTAWLTAFTALAQAENDTWGGKALEKLLGLTTSLEVDLMAHTVWNDLTGRFTIAVPRRHVLCPLESIPAFTQQLTEAFEPSLERSEPTATEAPRPLPVTTQPHRSASVTELPTKAPLVSIVPVPIAQPQALSSVTPLPCLDTLLEQPPYRLAMTGGTKELIITGSHSRSLVLLEKYLKSWCSVDHGQPNKPLTLDIKLLESPFGQGKYDGLIITARQKLVSPPLIVAVIERAVGYQLKQSSEGFWDFVRSKELPKCEYGL